MNFKQYLYGNCTIVQPSSFFKSNIFKRVGGFNKNNNISFAGFLVKKINSTTHYLVRFILEPGLKSGSLTCTVNTSNVKNYQKKAALERSFITVILYH